MKDFQTRIKNKTRFIHSCFFLFILLVIFIFLVKSVYSSFSKRNRAETERLKYQEQLNELKNKKMDYKSKIESLKTNRGVEEELRNSFNVVKKGETMIRIIEE